MLHDEHRAYPHRDVGGDGGSLDAPVQHKDGNGRQDDVQTRTDKHGVHRLVGVSRRAHHIVVRISDVENEQSRQHIYHEVVGIGQRLVASSEQPQNRVEEQREHADVERAKQQGHHDGVAQDGARHVLVSLAQHNRCARARAGTDEHTECRAHIHHREGHGEARDGVRSHAMTDKDSVDDVVDRHHHDAHHGWHTVFPQQPPNRGLVQTVQTRVVVHFRRKNAQKYYFFAEQFCGDNIFH